MLVMGLLVAIMLVAVVLELEPGPVAGSRLIFWSKSWPAKNAAGDAGLRDSFS